MTEPRQVKKCEPAPWQWSWIRSTSRVKQFAGHVGFGLRSEIPLCCVLEWATRYVLGQRAWARRLGCWYPTCRVQFVHCFFHREMIYPKEHATKYRDDEGDD